MPENVDQMLVLAKVQGTDFALMVLLVLAWTILQGIIQIDTESEPWGYNAGRYLGYHLINQCKLIFWSRFAFMAISIILLVLLSSNLN